MWNPVEKMADSVSPAPEGPPERSQPVHIRPRGWRKTFRSLRHRNFRLFFGGQFISLIGTWMQQVAVYWLVYRLTGSAVLLGVAGFAGQIPVSVLSPLGGLVADRLRRQYVVIATQIASMLLAVVLSILTLTGWVRVWEVIFLGALLGVVNAFDVPARQAFLIEMVGREDLFNAIALNSSMFNGARVVGPAIAGLLVAWIGEGWCFFANAVSYLAVIAGLLMMHIDRVVAKEEKGSPLENVIEGFRFARHTAPIRALLSLVGLVSLVAMPYTVLMPIFADRILHGGAKALGLLMGAIGVGAVIGALVLATRHEVRGLGKLIALAAIGFGLTLNLFAFSRWFWFSMAVLVLSGLSMMLQFTSTNTLIQVMVPDRLRGRVMSLYAMMFLGMAPWGALFAGMLANKIGSPLTVGIGGTASVVGGAIFLRKWPAMRRSARELIEEQGMLASPPAAELTGPRA